MVETSERNEEAARLMLRFAERTGISSERPPRRYLWTDAFAVCNFLGLARATGQARYTELALTLVDRVHHTLAQHRPDDHRTGWLSGLRGQEAEAHPTLGGLRIGKGLPERRANEPFDRELEWERDGQYFHYLTKWMHALDQVARATGEPVFNVWARELAEAAHKAFVYTIGGGQIRRMYWKMSIDLSRPLVPSMGQHDALDGFVTCVQLAATGAKLSGAEASPDVGDDAADFASMLDGHDLDTADPLGIGGLTADAFRVDQLMRQGAFPDSGLRDSLLRAALASLEQYEAERDLRRPAEHRLGFRELGLAIGLYGIASMREADALDARSSRDDGEGRALLGRLRRYDPLRDLIVTFWLDPRHRRASTWTEHQDINDVMLATALAPEGFFIARA